MESSFKQRSGLDGGGGGSSDEGPSCVKGQKDWKRMSGNRSVESSIWRNMHWEG